MPSLADAITSANLYAAWLKVWENQGCAGVDGVGLDDFQSQLTLNLDVLADEVRYGRYKPSALLRVAIDKKSGGTRPLSIPTIRDRLLQTAVCLVLTPLFEAEFEDASFAYRRGRSVDQAIARIERLRDQGYQWVVDADIRTFFDQVDHALLMAQVEQLVADADICRLINGWLKAVVVDGKQRYRLSKGLPQGSPISPMLANLYLDKLDEALLDKQHKLIRYADDFVILCKSEKQAERALQLTGAVLERLRLCFHQGKTSITHFDRGFRFLGVEFIRSLAFKSQYPEQQRADEPLPAQRVADSTIDITEPEPLSTMQQAFLTAGLQPGHFVPAPIQASPGPSEAAIPATLDMQALDEEVSARYDPRLKTLYLLEHGSVLGKESERFVIRYQGEVKQEIPAIHVDQIMVFGNAQITTQAMQFSLQKRIPIFLLSGQGHYYGVVDSFDTEPVLLHREQFLRAADDAFCQRLSVAVLRGKLCNSRLLLQRFSRHRDAPVLVDAAEQLVGMIRQLDHAESLDQLRGYEGHAARIYFQAFSAALDPAWQFLNRNKNPPLDPVNAMLSYGYTLLFYNVYTFLRTRGLNPHVGYLHPLRQGHPALASDMMEEFRAIIVDSVVFNIAFNRKLTPDDFIMPSQDGDGCLLTPTARKVFIRQLEQKFNSRLQHPLSGLQLDYRRCIEHQINHLVAVIRKQTADYQAMAIR